jgi:hypothetical protein
MWMTLIISSALMILTLAFVQETFEPLLLQRRAARVRLESRDWQLHTEMDEQSVQTSGLLKTYGLKPLKMDHTYDGPHPFLGFLCVTMAPFPTVMYFYGKKLRSWSKFAAQAES